MIRLLLCVLGIALGSSPALAADPLSYDDPGMHYQAPAGWERVDLGDTSDKDDPPAAVFAYHKGQSDVRTIVIEIKSFDGSLSDFVSQRRGEIRQGGSDTSNVFLKTQEPITLDNGMPGFLIVSSLNADSRPARTSYEYLFIDGQRSIDVTYTGLSGDIDDRGGKATLSSLYIVAYPKRARN